MSTSWALALSGLLLAGNGFFVAAEFALVASKRHRLEQAAAAGSRGAGAALAGVRQLSLTLAGAQLGITLCSLGLGALAEPAIAHLLDPAFQAVGLPAAASYAVAFVLAPAFVVFAHMVVGEMAPKSWAITDPERSALLLAPPFRAFTRAARPVIAALNAMANGLLRLVKVPPQDQLAAAHGPDELRMLLHHSREDGLLPADQHRLLTAMLQLRDTTVASVMTPRERVVAVAAGASATEVERASQAYGRSRLAVIDGDGIVGVVHVRDAVRATTAGADPRVTDLMTTPYRLRADLTVLASVRAMRLAGAQWAVVTGGDPPGGAAVVGVVALEDLLEEVIGEFDDETDPMTPVMARQPIQ